MIGIFFIRGKTLKRLIVWEMNPDGGGLSLISQSGADGALIYKGKIFSKGFVAREFVPLRQHLEYYLSRLESLRHAYGQTLGDDAENGSF